MIFSSDNGGETNVTSNAPLRGGKSQLYEGGIRVPLIVRWPERIDGGRVSDIPSINTDFYPTLLAAAGIQSDPGQALDGVSMLATWEDPSARPEREFLTWHYPLEKPHFLGGVSAGAIRVGRWKLIENFVSGEDELFDLKTDPSETRNIAPENPETVASLKKKLEAWRTSVGTRSPKNSR